MKLTTLLSLATSREPQVEVPVKGTDTITWDNTIKNYFTQMDVNCMKDAGGFDLSNKADVVANADTIYTRVSNKSMPIGEKKWTQQMCDNFKTWKDGGTP